MNKLIWMPLPQFGLLRFSGIDAQNFLQGQLSCDVAALQIGQAQYGSYNTPKGRMLASFLLWHDNDGYVMQLPRTLCEPIRKRLSMYVLRAKVKVVDLSDACALTGMFGDDVQSMMGSAIEDFPKQSMRLIQFQAMTLLLLDNQRVLIADAAQSAQAFLASLSVNAQQTDPDEWDRLNIHAGIPFVTAPVQDQIVPLMANLDLIGGVSFNKGCYPGQEIVARTHYLGHLKQRMYLAHIVGDDAPAPGDKIYSSEFGDQAAGTIVNVAPAREGGYDTLTIVRTESAAGNAVHWKTPDGPLLKFMDLPYKF